MIPSREIPQADVLLDVLKTVISVAHGGTSYQDIARDINKVERQGRYYRRAAEIMGFITLVGRNHVALTALGQTLIDTGASIQNPIFLEGVLGARIFQRIIPFLELHPEGATADELESFLMEVADLGSEDVAHRRVLTIKGWLSELGIATLQGNRYVLATNHINQTVNALRFDDVTEPILPRATNLQEYQEVEMRAANARQAIVTYRNQAANDRADNAHRTLVNIVSNRIKASGAIPKYNQIIDLATRQNDLDFIFEMKSITAANCKQQLRRGLSQLYEYKYLQNLPDSNLVLVIETSPPADTRWMIDYLERDRDISVIWDGDGNLYGTPTTIEKINFLGLIAQ